MLGICWEYVGVDMLNYFINTVEPIRVFVIDRYTGHNETIDTEIYDNESHKWVEITATKIELIKKLQNDKSLCSGIRSLKFFEDDIVVLAKFNPHYNEFNDDYEFKDYHHYVFFIFDCDVSDCIIGKFRTEDSEEIVIESLYNWLKEQIPSYFSDDFVFEPERNMDNGIQGYHELPVEFAKNYVGF
jgi:hypothetical protein